MRAPLFLPTLILCALLAAPGAAFAVFTPPAGVTRTSTVTDADGVRSDTYSDGTIVATAADGTQLVVFTAAVSARRKAAAIQAAIDGNTGYKKANEGYKIGFKYSLENKPPVIDVDGNYSYSTEQINKAKDDADRLAPVYDEKVDDLIEKIKADIGYEDKSKQFQKHFDKALKRDYFDPVITPAATGKPEDARLNVQIKDNLLRRALTEATFATAEDPAEMEDALAKLAKAKEKNDEAKAALAEKREEKDAEACRELRAQRDSEFSLDDGGRGPASDEILNNSVIIK